MKYCCDKCEKVIEYGIFGSITDARTIVIKNKLFNDETVLLCNECFEGLRAFLNKKKGIATNVVASKNKTNIDKIKELPAEELAHILYEISDWKKCLCIHFTDEEGCGVHHKNRNCEVGILQWLQQETEGQQEAEWKDAFMRHFTKIE